MGKRILKAGALLVLVILLAAGGVAYYVWGNLGRYIKEAIEKHGSETTATSVTLSGVDISAKETMGSIKGLKIGNPAGFESNTALTVKDIAITLDLPTLASDPVVVKDVLVQSPQVVYELSPKGDNWIILKKNIQGYVKNKKTDDDHEAPPGIIIDKMTIENGSLVIRAPGLGDIGRADMPAIVIKDIGRKNNGASPDEIARVVVDAMLKNATKTALSLDLNKLLGADAATLLGASGLSKELDKVDKYTEDLKKAEDSIKGYFGGK